jgi:hypothetical protein
MSNYCYIIQEREFLRLNYPIYKIGKTTQDGLKRYKQYPKGSKIILFIEVDDCHEFETNVKKLFNGKYVQKTEYGIEYYEGDKDEMIMDYIKIKNSLSHKNKNLFLNYDKINIKKFDKLKEEYDKNKIKQIESNQTNTINKTFNSNNLSNIFHEQKNYYFDKNFCTVDDDKKFENRKGFL